MVPSRLMLRLYTTGPLKPSRTVTANVVPARPNKAKPLAKPGLSTTVKGLAKLVWVLISASNMAHRLVGAK